MRDIVAYHEMKRGDAILFKYKYIVNYSGVDGEVHKDSDLAIYSKRNREKDEIGNWFSEKYANQLNSVRKVGLVH